MKVFHLSHTDLDGYTCQFIAQEFFEDIVFFNANYGKEVGVRLDSILESITTDPAYKLGAKFHSHKAPSFLILITDLNLTLAESTSLHQRVEDLKSQGYKLELILLDHHISGQECANKYSWYFLDSARCATKITWEYLLEHYTLKTPTHKLWLHNLVEMTNSVDIWLEDGYNFEFGKVAMGMISASNELNRFMFESEHREYKFRLIESTKDFLERENGAVEFDNALFCLKKQILGGDPQTQTMDSITSQAQVRLLQDKKQECSIHFQDKLGFLSYSMGGISVLANLFLRANPEYDFYIDVNSKGNVSLRANGKCDVSALSKEYFNGGGHKNASGGKLDGFRESFCYADIKKQVLQKLQIL
ncbi:DHH family phosphoesterase [uncultured Helicobacter sp.]|uniref:DHH family phosphoesterase n=1 Tax=uncultured Helicobacter sp. TaxID=175537 RepID=UPI001C3A1F0D|nr:3',5'-cyclic-nucleotide phosphodiesterase [Candidatus Helicobacter avicola]